MTAYAPPPTQEAPPIRKVLAAAALAGAALGFTAPAASAACYGARNIATVCYTGDLSIERGEREVCVYTGGDTCTPYYVPWYTVNGGIESVEACVSKYCAD